jgi:hypothetical protein
MKDLSHPPAEVTVSLQGTLETFALPDVLVLLSSTKKDGELRVEGGRVDGQLWLDKGQIVQAQIRGATVEAVDAIFELLRLETGTFNFENDSAAPDRSDAVAVDGVLADAQVRLGEWNEIAKVVPHLGAVVDMASDAPGDEVIITRDQWSLLRRVAGGRSVNDLMVALGRSEYETCKTVKELVDAKLASIDVTAPAKVEPAPAKAAERQPPATVEQQPAAGAAGPAPAATGGSDDNDAAKPAPKAAAVTAARVGDAGPSTSDPATKISTSTAGAGVGTSKIEDTKSHADTVAAKQDELDALAELASRPRRLRASTSTAAEPGTTGPSPTATKAQPSTGPASGEAKVLVAQLAALSGDDEEAVAAKVTEHLENGGELPEVPEGDEPINRGLLLKFLSSVRN